MEKCCIGTLDIFISMWLYIILVLFITPMRHSLSRNPSTDLEITPLQEVVQSRMETLEPILDFIVVKFQEKPRSIDFDEEMKTVFDYLNGEFLVMKRDLGDEFDGNIVSLFEEIVVSYLICKFKAKIDHTQFPDFFEVFLKYARKDAVILGALLNANMPKEHIVSIVRQQVKDSINFATSEVAAQSLDSLTQTLNRATFERVRRRELERLLRNESGMGMAQFFIDLDKFKTVNDTLGHAEGDRILREVAGILQKELRAIDVVGRFGGDEFWALVVVHHVEGAKELAERLRQKVEDANLGVTLSMGIAFSKPNGIRSSLKSGGSVSDWLDVEEKRLTMESDEAMQVAKHGQGRNAVCVFEELTDREKRLAHAASMEAAKKREKS